MGYQRHCLSGNRKVTEHLVGDGTVTWNKARWEDLPTMYNIVNTLADLEIVEYRGASLTRAVGGKDISDQRILTLKGDSCVF